MCTAKHDAVHADTSDSDFFFKEQSCIYIVEILPLVPTVKFCTSPMDNSTTLVILKLGTVMKIKKVTGAYLDLGLSLVLADP